MSITRTAPYGTLTDDSGAGTDGTVYNNAWLQGLLDLLDARWSRVTITSTGSQNNLSISEADFVVFNNATDLTITGIVAPASPAKPGKPFRYICMGAGNVYWAHQNASSTAANKLVNFVTSGNTPCAGGTGTAAGGRGMFVYDDVNSRWQMVAHEQGAWITPTTPTYSGSGAMTYTTVTTTTMRYRISGRTLELTWDVTGTVGGTPSTNLLFTLPNGYTAVASFGIYLDNLTSAALYQVSTSSNNFSMFKDLTAAGNFVAGSVRLLGTATIEVQ